MYAPAQAMQQALNRRLQRQQMEQSADIADQNNAMQLLSQGQEAAQNDLSREAALERLKEEGAKAVLRARIAADADVKQADLGAGAKRAVAQLDFQGKDLVSGRAAETGRYAADKGLERGKYAADASERTGKYRADKGLAGVREAVKGRGDIANNKPTPRKLSAAETARVNQLRTLAQRITAAEGGDPMVKMMIEQNGPGQVQKWRDEYEMVMGQLDDDVEIPDDAVVK